MGNKKTIDELTEDEFKALKDIMKRGYSPKEVRSFLDALSRQKSNQTEPYKIGRSHVKIAVFGDTHIGNINYDEELMKFFAKEIKRQKIDFVLNTGDIFDGWYQYRPHSIFEQNAVGFDAQMKKAVEEFSQIDYPIFFITGNHSYNTYIRGAGVEAGTIFEERLRKKGLEAHFLGNAEGDVILKNNVKLKMLHPDGGTAYAVSYKPQKIIESLSGGEKPQFLFIGHFHKMEYLFYRNIHCYQTGTFLGQTKYMRGRNIAAHKGFWILDIYSNSKGEIGKIIQQMYPAYK